MGIGYYVPISVMIAPMFAEDDSKEKEEEDADPKAKKSCLKRFCSFSSTVSFVKPFLSAITVSKCFMLISATFLFGGGVVGTIGSQIVTMIALLIFTLIWSFNDLKLNGLTQNKPGFPFSVNLIRVAGFGCGLLGCIIEMIRYFDAVLLDDALEFILLLCIMAVIGIAMFIIFQQYHSKYNKLDHDIDLEWAIRFDGQFKVVPLHPQEELSGSSSTIVSSSTVEERLFGLDVSSSSESSS